MGPAVVVDNRTGAGGMVGADTVAKARPDGYTLLIGNVGTQSINPSLYKKMPYDPDTAFAPVSLFADLPFVLVVSPTLPAKTPKEFVALAKATPDKLHLRQLGQRRLAAPHGRDLPAGGRRASCARALQGRRRRP